MNIIHLCCNFSFTNSSPLQPLWILHIKYSMYTSLFFFSMCVPSVWGGEVCLLNMTCCHLPQPMSRSPKLAVWLSGGSSRQRLLLLAHVTDIPVGERAPETSPVTWRHTTAASSSSSSTTLQVGSTLWAAGTGPHPTTLSPPGSACVVE